MLLLVVGHIGRGTGMRSRSHWLEGERRKEIRECVVERRGSIQRASLQPQLGDRDRDQSSPCGKKTFSADLQKSLRVQYVYSPSQPAIPRHETASLMAGHGTDECDLDSRKRMVRTRERIVLVPSDTYLVGGRLSWSHAHI